jgi:hypothetical protein
MKPVTAGIEANPSSAVPGEGEGRGGGDGVRELGKASPMGLGCVDEFSLTYWESCVRAKAGIEDLGDPELA